MHSFKYSTDSKSEFFLDEGCHIIEILNDPKHIELSFARARVEIGAATEPHKLSEMREWYYILQGEGLMHIDEHSFAVVQQDVIQIPANALQWIENKGAEDLIFLCICSPAWNEAAYVSV